jgi:ABC-type nitrate/sulfonate/bicarbonate transport system ATPase subunit
MSARLQLNGISKQFPDKNNDRLHHVLDAVSFSAEPGEFISLIGPSGCGKTTLLRIVHGLERASAGVVTCEGRVITAPDLRRAFVFQHFNLFPWRTVEENIGFGLEVRGDTRRDQQDRINDMLRLVGLDGFGRHYPHEISGGMQQRVGIARALILDPAILLMDEPFGALDAITREKLQRDIADILARQPKTTLFVTHNMDEAIYFSDRILVFGTNPGRIVEEVKVMLDRPRQADLVRASREFAEIREHLWSLLSQELQP